MSLSKTVLERVRAVDGTEVIMNFCFRMVCKQALAFDYAIEALEKNDLATAIAALRIAANVLDRDIQRLILEEK